MSDAVVTDPAVPAGELALDPFSYQPGVASKIGGLGGTARSHDENYAFHTDYVEADEGPAHFIVRFQGLTAKQGTLVLRVHMLPDEEGAHVRLATSDRIALNRLIHHGGEFIVRFEGFHGVRYALYGGVMGISDAAAQGLTVTLDRPADPTRKRHVAAEARSTDFGRKPVKEVSHILSMATPTLADPVAQVATLGQMAEPAADHWLSHIDTGGLSPLDSWDAIYTLQVLRRYGMLEKGARGLGLGLLDTPVPAALAAFDIDVLATRHGAEPAASDDAGLADLSRRAGKDRSAFERRVSGGVAPLGALPVELLNFDFLWSTQVAGQLGSVAAAMQFVDQAMACLRPGGLAIHTMRYDPFARDQREGDDRVARRRDIERLELILISRRYDIAQFKLAAGDPLLETVPGIGELSSVGLIVRKPRLME